MIIRLGIVGFGGMGRGMLRAAEKLEDVEVTAVVEVREEGRELAEEEFGLVAFEDLDGMLQAEATDAVYIATPNKFHAEQSTRCLEAGVHVFCEKPMAMNAAEGERMIAAARRADRKLTINLSYRANGHARALKSALDAGMLGEVYFARTGWMRNRGIPGRGWFTSKELGGGGPLIDLGVHRIDMALWLMGEPEPVSVTGVTFDMLGKRIAAARGGDYGVEDLAAGFVRFANGAALSLEASWATNSEWREDMHTDIYGTEGGGTHRSVGGGYEFEARLWGDVAGTFGETILEPLRGPGHLEAFINAVRDDAPVPVGPEDALRVQRVIDGIYRSAELGREVDVTGETS
ncbi:MAG: Gfo/Idh/MocA family oxidoreductase [Candidatus Brocadiaceae bacterium]|jgi:predicted dehydrogenase